MTVQQIQSSNLWFVLRFDISQSALWEQYIHRALQGEHFRKEMDFVENHVGSINFVLR
jgi:hypothetical protein